jgi:hypothetical protein
MARPFRCLPESEQNAQASKIRYYRAKRQGMRPDPFAIYARKSRLAFHRVAGFDRLWHANDTSLISD